MRRREFIVGLGSAAAWPLAARAQQPAMPVMAWFTQSSLEAQTIMAFHQGLAETGYVEGRNVTIEYRSADGDVARLPLIARELVSRRGDDDDPNCLCRLYGRGSVWPPGSPGCRAPRRPRWR
jgi:putative tryptophan/tyrosine transport system substrate-binding protein